MFKELVDARAKRKTSYISLSNPDGFQGDGKSNQVSYYLANASQALNLLNDISLTIYLNLY